MQCPECHSTHIRKNGKSKGKQNYICVPCHRQFIDCYEPSRGYSDDLKRQYLELYVNGMGFRAIEWVTGVHHTTVITSWSYRRFLLTVVVFVFGSKSITKVGPLHPQTSAFPQKTYPVSFPQGVLPGKQQFRRLHRL